MNLPNKLTLSRILLIPVFLILVFFDLPHGKALAAGVFILAAMTDGLDGYLARSRKQVTRFGKFMDPVADKLLVATALISLVAIDPDYVLPAIIIIGREFAVSGLRSVAVAEGIVIAASPLGKIKTITQVIAITLILLENYPFRLINLPLDRWSLWLALFFTVYSGIDYFWRFRKKILQDDKSEIM